jgi:hypothetical protein
MYLRNAHGIEDGEIATVIGKLAHVTGVSLVGTSVGSREFTLAWRRRSCWRDLRIIHGGAVHMDIVVDVDTHRGPLAGRRGLA